MPEKAIDLSQDLFVRQAVLQESRRERVRCNLCARHCHIPKRGLGWCRTRQNRGGKLVTLIYGMISSIADNPIEKKPFYHFRPDSRALTVGSWSCNFGCPWCQNWGISKQAPPKAGRYLSPDDFVALAEDSGCQGTSISFNEPTLSFEWALDVFPIAHGHRLYNTFVTNGYMTPEALNLLIDAGLDAMNVDIKGEAEPVTSYCQGVDVEKVWANCAIARRRGLHIEVTTLVIPGVNDEEAGLRRIAGRIAGELGVQTPWHVTSYFPEYRFTAPPTPLQTLERAWKVGKEAGLEFVYIGNIPQHNYENTYCPACNTLLIQRAGFNVLSNNLQSGCCPRCKHIIPGIWERETRWTTST